MALGAGKGTLRHHGPDFLRYLIDLQGGGWSYSETEHKAQDQRASFEARQSVRRKSDAGTYRFLYQFTHHLSAAKAGFPTFDGLD
jgi:hypothetical protein